MKPDIERKLAKVRVYRDHGVSFGVCWYAIKDGHLYRFKDETSPDFTTKNLKNIDKLEVEHI